MAPKEACIFTQSENGNKILGKNGGMLMSIYVNVFNQKLSLPSPYNEFVAGSQEFVQFKFNLSEDWDALLTCAQFTQKGKSYNQYLDDENCIYLPSEICEGQCTLMLYGTGSNTIATTNYLTLKITENIFISDASSTEISETLYTQLINKFNTLVSANAEFQKTIALKANQTDLTNEINRAKSAEEENADAIAQNTSDIASKAEKTDVEALHSDVDEIKAYLGYSDSDIVGLCVDYKNSVFTRLGGAIGKEAGSDFDIYNMYGGRRRCNVADDGTINAYYGDENYTDDGSNGQVMVYQPAFYYKVVPIVLEKNTSTNKGYHLRRASYYVSDTPHHGFKLHPAFYNAEGNPVDYILYSAYEGSMYDVSASTYVNDTFSTDRNIDTGDLICSVADVKPISGKYKMISIDNLEIMAQNRGENWHIETIKTVCANLLLMMIELGNMNTQTSIGLGITSIIHEADLPPKVAFTGATKQLGNGTGMASETHYDYSGEQITETTNGKLSVSYRGIENVWGNLWKVVNGINIYLDGEWQNNNYINGTLDGGEPYIADDFNFDGHKLDGNYTALGLTLPSKSGYISAMGYATESYDWLIIPSENTGTSATPVGDHLYAGHEKGQGNFHGVMFGGNWYSGAPAGAFYFHYANLYGYRTHITNGRLVYVPQ